MCDGNLDEYYGNIEKKRIKTWSSKTGLDNPYDDVDLKEKRKKHALKNMEQKMLCNPI